MNLATAFSAPPDWQALVSANMPLSRGTIFDLLYGQQSSAIAPIAATSSRAGGRTRPTAETSGTVVMAPAATNRPAAPNQTVASPPIPVASRTPSTVAPDAGALGNMLGIGDNPIYQRLRQSGFLLELGAGLASGPDFGSGVAAGLRLHAQNAPGREADARDAQARRLTAERLRSSGPEYSELADAVELGVMDAGDALRTVWSNRQQAGQQAQELERERQNAQFLTDPQLRQMVENGAMSFQDAYKLQTGGAADPVGYGTTLNFGRDEAGNLVPLQAGNDGTLVRSELPPGVVSVDPGAAAGARAGATYDAKTVAAANAALPAVEQNLGIALDAIDRLRNDKAGLEANFSQWGALPRSMYVQGGTPLANWMTNLNQASGQAFMQARQALKGGGQITDYEGKRAEAAISRISDAAKSGDMQTFLAALDEFEAAVTDGYAKLREVAGGNYQPGAGAGGGDIFDRYGLE